jgi:hypothetical protein
MAQCDETAQRSVEGAFDLCSVKSVQCFDVNDGCHLIYHVVIFQSLGLFSLVISEEREKSA